MHFKDIPGHEEAKARLRKSVQDNRIPHAQLFLGIEGTGNLAMALAYARYIQCTQTSETEACGSCPSCLKYDKYAHPDLHFVFPVVKTSSSIPISDTYIEEWRTIISENPHIGLTQWFETIGTEKSQGQIYTRESNEIIRKLSLKTYEAEYKIMIIWMPEKMHVSCANKLLKILEEPPPKTIFLLVTSNSEQILQTILSRTQLVKIGRIDNESLLEELKKRFDTSEKELRGIVRASEGNLLNAMENLSEDSQRQKLFEQFANFMRMTYTKNVKELSSWAEDMHKMPREKQKSFLEYSLRMLRENFILNNKQNEIVFLDNKENGFAEKFSPFINKNNINKLVKEFNDAHYHIERNGNAKIIFFDLSLKVIMLIRS